VAALGDQVPTTRRRWLPRRQYRCDKLQVNFLQIGQGVIGAYLTSLSFYAFVCRNERLEDELSFAKRFSYRPALTEFEGREDHTTKTPPRDRILKNLRISRALRSKLLQNLGG
jgi:hypothetical protein